MNTLLRCKSKLQLVVLVTASALACTARAVPLGGRWFIMTERSELADAGGYHEFLSRDAWLGWRRVAETRQYRYIGDDCVIYVEKNGVLKRCNVVCGSAEPHEVQRSVDDATYDHFEATGLSGDPIVINGKTFSLRELKVIGRS
jgi:hypothetical protein